MFLFQHMGGVISAPRVEQGFASGSIKANELTYRSALSSLVRYVNPSSVQHASRSSLRKALIILMTWQNWPQSTNVGSGEQMLGPVKIILHLFLK